MISKKQFLMLGVAFATLVLASSGYADITSAAQEAEKEMGAWVGALGSLGLAITAGIWIISEVTPIRFFDHFVAEQKRKLFFLLLFFTALVYFKGEVADLYKKVTNPITIFKGE
jgi:hypothetical protein